MAARGGAQKKEGAGPDGGRWPCTGPCTDPELARPPALPGAAAPAKGGDGETRGAVGAVTGTGVQKGGPVPTASSPSEGESQVATCCVSWVTDERRGLGHSGGD